MCADTAMFPAIPRWNLEALLDDPLVRIVMHADGVTRQDILAAFEIAYQAVSTSGAVMPSSSRPASSRPASSRPASSRPASSRPADPFGHDDDPRGQPATFAQRHV